MPAAPDATSEPDLPVRDRVVTSLALYVAVMSIYFASGMAAARPWIDAATPLDHAIPFVPEAMAGYALVYVVPLALLAIATTASEIRRMTRAAILAYAMAAPFFVAFPFVDADPPLAPATWSEHLLAWNRAADTSQNLFPSMHVGLATLLALTGARRSRAWGAVLGAAALAIAVSTLLVKQHVIVDLPAGAIVGWLADRIVRATPAGGVAGGRA